MATLLGTDDTWQHCWALTVKAKYLFWNDVVLGKKEKEVEEVLLVETNTKPKKYQPPNRFGITKIELPVNDILFVEPEMPW
jgi:hypothetical protein